MQDTKAQIRTQTQAQPQTHKPTRRVLLAWMGGAPMLASSSAWARRDALPLMLATDAPDQLDPAPFLVSEKLDGVRALWDGQQLRFRSGLPVPAPAWFLRRLPAVPLDGELWLGRSRFDELSGLVRRAEPSDAEWRALRYELFDLPAAGGSFAERARRLADLAADQAWPQLAAVAQLRLPDRVALLRQLGAVVAAGGEGLVLHRADALWQAGRSQALLKLKPLHDAEAQVIAHLPGRGKYAGQVGALRVRGEDGIEFQIGSGLSDADRLHPPAIGAQVSYIYRGKTPAGVPRFASFLRVREL
jgi:DNA ligase-1